MDITPLYELRTRLKHVMISGCSLIGEDFRLKRAAEAIKPLTAASPVFAKIGQLLDALLKDCQEASTLVLEAITLVDAVLCTQAAVDVPGELQEIETAEWGSTVTSAPYSALYPLLDALTSSGNGRYGYVLEAHETQPELFEDYRVKPVLVRALGASYSELADHAAQWLKECGTSILPLLEQDFDPKGKKEMVRRVHVIDALAGASANDFYIKHLPQAEKEVRSALIYGLRHCPKNTEFLFELAKTERGNCKKTTLHALASLSDEQTRQYWHDFMDKNPLQALPYLEETDSPWASDLVGEGLRQLLEPWHTVDAGGQMPELTKETAALIEAYLRALPGKTGNRALSCWYFAATMGSKLDRCIVGEKSPWCLEHLSGIRLGWNARSQKNFCFSRAIPCLLHYAMVLKPDQNLAKLALTFYDTIGEPYFPAALTAQLFFAPEREFSDWLEAQMYQKAVFGKKLRKNLLPGLESGLSLISWNEKDQCYEMKRYRYSQVEDTNVTICQRVPQPLNGYVTDLLIDCRTTGLDFILFRWVRPHDRTYCEKLAHYFYERARTVTGNNNMYLTPMKQCGMTECAGLATKHFKTRGTVSGWEVWSYLQQMPGTWQAKQKEAEALCELVKAGNIKGTNLRERLEEFIDLARAESCQERNL